jgi:hypothetical protein
MLMRSHSPIHGVGRLAWTRGASQKVNAPNATRTDEDNDACDGVQREAFPVCRGCKTHRDEHEENRRARQNDVHGVAQRATACGQHFALVHWGKRPQEAKGSIGHSSPPTIRSARSRPADFQTPPPKAIASTV